MRQILRPGSTAPPIKCIKLQELSWDAQWRIMSKQGSMHQYPLKWFWNQFRHAILGRGPSIPYTPFERAQMSNLVNSRFHNLPWELILSITKDLSSAEIFILQHVCRLFRNGFRKAPLVQLNSLTHNEVHKYNILLRRNKHQELQKNYYQKCSSPAPHIDTSLACSACCRTHILDLKFSEAQLL